MTIIQALISAVFYRLGGMDQSIIPFTNTKWRDWGCPAVFVWNAFPHQIEWHLLAAVFLLMWGALTQYWDEFCGFDNFWLHGFMVGLSTFPLYWAGVHWWAILAYSVTLCVSFGCLHLATRNAWLMPISDWIEEPGRGFLIIILAKILFIL